MMQPVIHIYLFRLTLSHLNEKDISSVDMTNLDGDWQLAYSDSDQFKPKDP